MSEQREVVILSGVRTAIGDYGGSLKDIPPSELAARVVKEAVSRAKIDPKDVGQCVFGNVIHTEPKDMYISRLACVNGGLPHDTGALTLNRLCGSGLQAVNSAAHAIAVGDGDVFVGGMRYGEIPGTGQLHRILINKNLEELRREPLLVDLRRRIRDVKQGRDGLLYVLTDGEEGAILKIEPAD